MKAIVLVCALTASVACFGVTHYRVLGEGEVASRLKGFAATDTELYSNTVSNAEAFDFLKERMPRFECPDEDIVRTYYFRWWVFRKHLRRTSEGWVITEFLPNVPYAGAHNTIVCPAGHHLREARWLADPDIAADAVRFWLASTNSVHRWNYASWPVSGLRWIVEVTGDRKLAADLLDDAVRYYRGWEKGFTYHTYPEGQLFPMGGDGKGMFTSIDDREGTEMSLGGNGYRPLMNAAMWGAADTIAWAATLAGRSDLAAEFAAKAKTLEKGIKDRLWNPERNFFTVRTRDGTLGDVRELHGYAPWYFGLELSGYEKAWERLTDETGFFAPFGLACQERSNPKFTIAHDGHACQWNGPVWPFATALALTAYANYLQGSHPSFPVPHPSFSDLIRQYAASQVLKRPDGTVVPWIDENIDPFTGEWLARTIRETLHKGTKRYLKDRGKDYNHSTFCDLVIGGLCGFIPRAEGSFVLKPLAPKEWGWWCLDGVRYHGRDVTILFDRDGTRYGKGKGLVVLPRNDPNWNVDEMNADYVVYVPDQPKEKGKTDPAVRGESCNEHFHVIWDAPRKVFHAFWTQGTDESSGDLHVVYARSTDKGRTWTDPVTLAGSEYRTHKRMQADWQIPFLTKSGRLYCLWNQQIRTNPHREALYGFYSDDGGLVWSAPELVESGVKADPGAVFGRPGWINWQLPLRLGDGGRFLAACSTRRQVRFWQFDNMDDDPEVSKIAITEYRGGKAILGVDRMKGGPFFTPEDKFVALQEGSVVKLPDGRLFVLMRSTVGHPVWSQSRDNGMTWDDPKILLEHDGGRPFLHSLSPCPMYDWKGPEAGSGFYFALIHDEFDFNEKKSAYRVRGPLKLIAGRFEPKAEQPIAFLPPKPFPSRKVANACYSSYTVVDGEGVLWQPDAKYNLIGRKIGKEWFE